MVIISKVQCWKFFGNLLTHLLTNHNLLAEKECMSEEICSEDMIKEYSKYLFCLRPQNQKPFVSRMDGAFQLDKKKDNHSSSN